MIGAHSVCVAQERSLATIGSTSPVIEMPVCIPYTTLREMAFVSTQSGHVVMHRDAYTARMHSAMGALTMRTVQIHLMSAAVAGMV